MGGWQEQGGRAFTIQLPSTFHVQPAQNVDSEIGRWGEQTRSIEYDYGSYSDNLMESDYRRDRHVCEVEIGGRRARLVTARAPDGQYIAAAHWPNLGPGMSAVDPLALTVVGTAADSAGRRELLASLWTVRFRE